MAKKIKASADSAAKESSLSRRRRNIIADVRKGRGVSVHFFRRNGWVIMFFTVVILVLTGMRYRTRVYMKEINQLRVELKKAENERMTEKSKYMSLIRERDMVELSQRHNMGLIFADKPPYILQLDEKDVAGAPQN